MHLLEFIDNPCPRHPFVKQREPCQLIVTLWLELVSPKEQQLWEVPLISCRGRDDSEPACGVSFPPGHQHTEPLWQVTCPHRQFSSSHVSLWNWAFVPPVYHDVYLLGDFQLLSPFLPCFVPALFPSFFFCSPVFVASAFPFPLFFSIFYSRITCPSVQEVITGRPIPATKMAAQPQLGKKTGENKLKSSKTEGELPERWDLLWDLFHNENSAMKKNLFYFFPLI